MKDKVLKLIFELHKSANTDWEKKLKRINIYDDVCEIYSVHDRTTANNILSFIVLAYHKDSEWLEIHKDRMENKSKILSSIVGEWALGDDVYKKVLFGKDPAANNVINWIFEYQKDWRWKEAELAFSYHSQIREMVKSISEDEDPKDALAKGKCIEEAQKRRVDGDNLVKRLQEDYNILDTIADQENRPKPTNDIKGSMTWEQFKNKKASSKNKA